MENIHPRRISGRGRRNCPDGLQRWDGRSVTDILLVEDNDELASLIEKFLKKDGYSVFTAESGEKAVDAVNREKFRCVLLDIMLPGIDGFAVCQAVRRAGNVPVIIMSAVADKENKLKGYELGTDDYIEKPIDIDLLRVKIRVMLKRAYQENEERNMITAGKLMIDSDAHKVYIDNKEIELNVKEFELLKILVLNKGKTLNKEYLFQKIWGADCFSENQTLTVHIKRLRDKLEKNPKKPEHIITVWGVGYKYEEI